MLAGLAFCEILSQYPQSAFQGSAGVTRAGQQQFATHTLRVHLLGLDSNVLRNIQRRRDDNKNKIFAFEGGGAWGERSIFWSKNGDFRRFRTTF